MAFYLVKVWLRYQHWPKEAVREIDTDDLLQANIIFRNKAMTAMKDVVDVEAALLPASGPTVKAWRLQKARRLEEKQYREMYKKNGPNKSS